jgi:hypothetical protein
MQSRRFVAVWLGVSVLSACDAPGDDLEQALDQAEDGSAIDAEDVAEDAAEDAAGDADGDAAGDAAEPVASLPAARGRLGQLAQRAYLKASNTGADDSFGYSVALSADGSTLAVGAYGEDSAATGTRGNQIDESAHGAGAVYVFRRRGRTWAQQAYLKASNTGASDTFGWSLALSADGATLAVGAVGEASAATGVDGDQTDDSAPRSGAVYVFARRGMKWRQEAYLKASNTGAEDTFGWSVALSADGAILAVGAPGEASAATGVGGHQADNSAPHAGAVYVLARSGTTWTHRAYVKASNTGADDRFGHRVALSADGATLAVSALLEASAATGVGGHQANNSAPHAGAVYVLARSGATWTHQAYVKASNTGGADLFGSDLALSADGATLAVGAINESSSATGIGGHQANELAPRSGAVYVYARGGTKWRHQAYVKASNTSAEDGFGARVALSADGSTLAVSAAGEASAATGVNGDQANDSAPRSGAVYVLSRTGTKWGQQAYVKASNTGDSDLFGHGVALSADGSALAVGAFLEDSAATGVGGSQASEAARNAGAVYVFERKGASHAAL